MTDGPTDPRDDDAHRSFRLSHRRGSAAWSAAGFVLVVIGLLMVFWFPSEHFALGGWGVVGVGSPHHVGPLTTAGAGIVTATYGALLGWTGRPRLLLTPSPTVDP